ncbi:ABA4-like family protein [Pontixanthobacter aestiaquae]|uniref:DUF4281 domain-containing protein n=1 Tax=Pontixanthobacter aestiaquae TaxID=1509367 RepID=A0A844Z5N9_9SPHN|nr:ABA4-like family protein [Pontixanthobacter aestiaquae]MDN3645908.1 ABA4-like family protein [Pontixanthobacter aestiaquae]MXO83098.1 DUF4281 domain-containing protein [Pontixanthobacter aestiaquae]
MWDLVFKSANYLAMAAWFALILLPRKPFILSAVMYLGVALLCLVYTVGMVSLIGGFVDSGASGEGGAGSFTSIEGVRALFASDGGLTVGWVHYLAFDLFVGLWIARDADAKYFSRVLQAPVLLFTFMLGPIGLFMWLIIREGRARTFGWKRNRINV